MAYHYQCPRVVPHEGEDGNTAYIIGSHGHMVASTDWDQYNYCCTHSIIATTHILMASIQFGVT